MKKAKKGFTIVELVVVIAVIAILAAVLIPTFISIVNRAKVSNDNQLVRNLNTALITEEADGNKAENMSQAIAIAEDYGYKLENLQAKADGYVLLWNQNTNRFYVESADGTITSNPEVTDFPPKTENYTYWEISKTLSEKHSTYLTEGNGGIEATNLGVDVSGISSAVNVTYTGNENKVIIATNGGDLSVTAENGHVAHYGFVKNLTVTAVNGADCYREHGYVGTLESFVTGKFVAEKGSQFHQTEEQIKTAVKPESNTFVDLGATYGVHRFDANGVCEIAGCNGGENGHKATSSNHKHNYVDGVCVCGEKEKSTSTQTCIPEIAIISNSEHKYSLALNENSVNDVEWARYEIVLRIPFYIAEYTKEDKKDDSEYEYIEQDYFKGYFLKSSLSSQYKLDFTYSVMKDANSAYIPYDMTVAFAFWNMENYGITPSGINDYYVTMPDGNNRLTKNVKYANWGDGNKGYYTTLFTAIGGIDIVNGLFGENAAETKCLIQNEDEIPTYIINVYDNNNELIGTNEYPPIKVCIAGDLEAYVTEFEKWLVDNKKENTRESLMEYHNNVQQFKTDYVEIEEKGLTEKMGVGATGSEIIKSIVNSNIQATTSTFGLYKIIIRADDNGYSQLNK